MLENEGVSIIHEVASDGPSELMADTINALDDEEYAQYMRYHIYCCEKKGNARHEQSCAYRRGKEGLIQNAVGAVSPRVIRRQNILLQTNNGVL